MPIDARATLTASSPASAPTRPCWVHQSTSELLAVRHREVEYNSLHAVGLAPSGWSGSGSEFHRRRCSRHLDDGSEGQTAPARRNDVWRSDHPFSVSYEIPRRCFLFASIWYCGFAILFSVVDPSTSDRSIVSEAGLGIVGDDGPYDTRLASPPLPAHPG